MLMKLAILIAFAVMLLPLTQAVYAQNILNQIGQAFDNLTSGITGGNNGNSSSSPGNNSSQNSTGQTTNATSNNGSSQSTKGQSTGEVAQGISNISDIENATGSNKKIFANNTDIDSNVTTLKGMEKSQMGNIVPGEQNTTFEGGKLQNITQK